MSEFEVPDPILNTPFDEPGEYWFIGEMESDPTDTVSLSSRDMPTRPEPYAACVPWPHRILPDDARQMNSF